MSLLAPTPHPTLGDAVRQQRAEQRAQVAEGTGRTATPVKRWLRRALAGFALMFALVGFGGGTAHAWPWDVGENVTAFITNFCGPNDVPALNDQTGVDTAFNLNTAAPSDPKQRKTILPDWKGQAGEKGVGTERLTEVYGDNKDIIAHPTYERYGFDNLKWSNYGSGCFSIGYWFTPINNLALNFFVKIPMMLGMGLLQWSMDNVLYDAFATITQPIVKIFTTLFKPIALFVAGIGIFWAFLRGRGAPQEVMKVGVFIVCVLGSMLWLGNNTSTLSTKANNFVTSFSANAACQIMNAQQNTKCDQNDPMGSINQALWYGIPYNAWLEGEVGQRQAKVDRGAEQSGTVGWGPALLNGYYAAPDKAGKKVAQRAQDWNNQSYSPDGKGTKTNAWTKDDIWNDVPFLGNIKAMCNDTEKLDDGDGSSDADRNRWMYGGECDSAGAGTAQMLPYFKGDQYASQLVGAFAGGYAAVAVVVAIGFAALYLMLQKMMFFFLLIAAPIFLTISMFGDEKRREFAKKYFELLVANVIKQCVAVCVVLFVSYTMSTLLYPRPGSGVPNIPWIVKPMVAWMFVIAMVLLALPFKKLATAAVKGDTSVVDKYANAPKTAAKTGAKVAALAGAAVATGGGAAAVGAGSSLGSVAMAGMKSGTALSQAGRMLGSRGGVGRALHMAGKGMHLKNSLMGAKAQADGTKRARDAGIAALAKSGNYETDEQGALTQKGKKDAGRAFDEMSKHGRGTHAADRAQQDKMKQFFAGYQATKGSFHPDDPNSPEKQHAERVAKAQQFNNAKREADEGSQREWNKNRGGVGGEPTNNAGSESADAASFQKPFADAAKSNVNGPSFSRAADLTPDVVQSGEQVLQQARVSKSEAAADPSVLLTGLAYGGGDTTRMDPTHPATEGLTQLRMAIAEGTDGEVQEVVMRVQSDISKHGVPDEINSIRTTGESAASFEPANVIGAMPSLGENPSWQDRAEAANTMQAAVSMMPSDHVAAPAVQEYAAALSNPSVDPGYVDGLKGQAIESLSTPVPEGAVYAAAPVAAAAGFASPSPQPQSWASEPAAQDSPPMASPAPPGNAADPYAAPQSWASEPAAQDNSFTAPPASHDSPDSRDQDSGHDPSEIRRAVREGVEEATRNGANPYTGHGPSFTDNNEGPSESWGPSAESGHAPPAEPSAHSAPPPTVDPRPAESSAHSAPPPAAEPRPAESSAHSAPPPTVDPRPAESSAHSAPPPAAEPRAEEPPSRAFEEDREDDVRPYRQRRRKRRSPFIDPDGESGPIGDDSEEDR